jgi:hypothetical protein
MKGAGHTARPFSLPPQEETVTAFIGCRRFHTRDPFGNRLEFLTPQAD